jgi:Dehydrogenases with different specificities (related to short-chain alcohol dehydrogenases)
MIDYLKKFGLKNKRAVVAGGAGLIGKSVVCAFAQAGAHVIIADINRDLSRKLSETLRKKKYHVDYAYFDITNIDSLEKNVRTLVRSLGGIDIWVNSSYPKTADWGAKVEDITSVSWRKNVDMHLNSYGLSSKYAAGYMKKNGGSIINLGSIYGLGGPDFTIYGKADSGNSLIYSAIKGGIVNMSRYLASYYGSSNIRFNTVCPGGVFDNQRSEFVKNYTKKVPLKRMARAEEIASTVLFLASDASSYITGATVTVDGGWTAI